MICNATGAAVTRVKKDVREGEAKDVNWAGDVQLLNNLAKILLLYDRFLAIIMGEGVGCFNTR